MPFSHTVYNDFLFHALFFYPENSELFLASICLLIKCEAHKRTSTGLTQAKEQGMAWAGSLV